VILTCDIKKIQFFQGLDVDRGTLTLSQVVDKKLETFNRKIDP